MAACHVASGTECVTVAVRRVDLNDRSKAGLLSWIDRAKIKLLPNTAGCFTPAEAGRTARIPREALHTQLLKPEDHDDEAQLGPDPARVVVVDSTALRI